MDISLDAESYLKLAVNDIITFIESCSKNLADLPEGPMISSVCQYMNLFRKGLNSRTDEESCVSRLDIIECEIEAMRSCLMAMEQIKSRMVQEEKLQ